MSATNPIPDHIETAITGEEAVSNDPALNTNARFDHNVSFNEVRDRAAISHFEFVDPNETVGTQEGGPRDNYAAQLGGSVTRWTDQLRNRNS